MSIFTVQRRNRSTSKPKQLRKQGLLPMALVDRTHETLLIQAPVDMLRKAMSHADGLGRLDIQIDGESGPRKAIVKHVEQDAIRRELIHVTLQEVSDEDSIKFSITVIAKGTPAASDGAELLLIQPTDHVMVRGKVGVMPDHLEVDVTGLEAGHHINAGDIPLPEGIELISSADATIFSLRSADEVTDDGTTEADATEVDAGDDGDAPAIVDAG